MKDLLDSPTICHHWQCPECDKEQIIGWELYDISFGRGYIVTCEDPLCASTFMVVPKARIEAELMTYKRVE